MNEQALREVLKLYEQKLQEYMTEDEYAAFSTQVSKLVFYAEVMRSPNDEFKEMVLGNWDAITAPTGKDDPYERCWQTGDYEDQECMFCKHRFECSGAESGEDDE